MLTSLLVKESGGGVGRVGLGFWRGLGFELNDKELTSDAAGMFQRYLQTQCFDYFQGVGVNNYALDHLVNRRLLAVLGSEYPDLRDACRALVEELLAKPDVDHKQVSRDGSLTSEPVNMAVSLDAWFDRVCTWSDLGLLLDYDRTLVMSYEQKHSHTRTGVLPIGTELDIASFMFGDLLAGHYFTLLNLEVTGGLDSERKPIYGLEMTYSGSLPGTWNYAIKADNRGIGGVTVDPQRCIFRASVDSSTPIKELIVSVKALAHPLTDPDPDVGGVPKALLV
jgi:hypothetical protein